MRFARLLCLTETPSLQHMKPVQSLVTNTAANVKWEPPSPLSQYGDDYYEYRVNVIGHGSHEITTHQISDRDIGLTNLHHNTNYTVWVTPSRHVQNKMEEGHPSENVTFKTECQGQLTNFIHI